MMNLIINSYGTTLTKENEQFAVITADGKQTFPPSKMNTISIGKAAKITSDAIFLAIKHEIDILFVNDTGRPEGRVWSIQYGSISSIRKAQLEFLYSSAVIPWVKELLSEKIDNQIALLMAFQPSKEETAKYNLIRFAINSMEDYKSKIIALDGEVLSDVSPSFRGWEGQARKKYFSVISKLLPDKYQFENRNRMPSTDIFNAMLNYAYGILYGKVEGSLIKAGIDPYAGIFHRDEYNRPALVYDFIEKYRMWMDYVVVQLCREQAVDTDLFNYDKDTGACRMESLSKRILIQSVNDYLSEIINISGKERSRQTHIELEAQALAQFFLKHQ